MIDMHPAPNALMRISSTLMRKAIYGWFFVVVFFVWPPVLSGLILAVMALAFLILKRQRDAWERAIRDDVFKTGPIVYEEQPRPPAKTFLINTIVVLAISAGFGILFGGSFGLNGWKWFALTVGFFALEEAYLILGAPVRHLVTDQGVWLLYDIDKIFVRFSQLSEVQVEREYLASLGLWGMLVPVRVPLAFRLAPRNPQGFTWRVRQLVLLPEDAAALRRVIPEYLFAEDERPHTE
ncbi:MAG: hypothetical protein JXB35_13450 [Anaerolineae bacterium]|nr:hypothetical protein [Anaerolineae bacterium]